MLINLHVKENPVNIEGSKLISTQKTKSSKLTLIWIQILKITKTVALKEREELHMMINTGKDLAIEVMKIRSQILIILEMQVVNYKLQR